MNKIEKTACLDRLHVVLFEPRLSENIGSVARACANMGCRHLHLVRSEAPDPDLARKLATRQGESVLENMSLSADLPSCLGPFHKVYGTTARSGGWRKGIKTPAKVAPAIIDQLRAGQTVAIVFGPEDKGLTNVETEICPSLLTIPTTDDSSLNLAHAVLVVLYECFKQALTQDFQPRRGNQQARPVTQAEYSLLLGTIRDALESIDFLKPETSSYFMLPLRRYLGRFTLYRNEFNMLMGICRQILWLGRREREDKNISTRRK